jgi:hypothetical protein
MGELRRHEAEVSTRASDADKLLSREVLPPVPSERRPGALLGFLAAALMAAAGIDAALWHHNTLCRELERRADTAEQRGAVLDAQNRSLREHLSSSEQHARALHDELLERDAVGDVVFIRLSSPASGAVTGSRTSEVTPTLRPVGQEVLR